MKSFFTAILLTFGLLPAITLFAQTAPPVIATKQWNAYWIAAPGETGKDYGIYYFRKNINLDTKPASFVIRVSADNRYKLYVNGVLVSLGPARGDTYYWNYETVNLAPYLQAGKNTIAALVWNEAEYRRRPRYHCERV